MSMEQLTKLVKVLGYTASSNDNEALNACRMANVIMKSMNLTWEQLIKDKTIVVNEIISAAQPAQHIPNAQQAPTPASNAREAEIEMMLRVCMSPTNWNRMSSSGRQFIRSLDDWYRRNHHLTDRQIDALRNWYNRI